jgi:hypothetical protein
MNGVEIVNVRVILRWWVEITEGTNTYFSIFVLYIFICFPKILSHIAAHTVGTYIMAYNASMCALNKVPISSQCHMCNFMSILSRAGQCKHHLRGLLMKAQEGQPVPYKYVRTHLVHAMCG